MNNSMPTQDEIKAFCEEHSVAFYRMGTPDNWDDTTMFRAATHEFPSRGISVPIAKVVEWLTNPPFIGEGI